MGDRVGPVGSSDERARGRVLVGSAVAAVIGCMGPSAASAQPAGNDTVLMAQAEAEKQFAIAAQPLPSALLQFMQQSGMQVAYKTDEVRGLQTAGVTGSFPSRAALQRLLAGTGLTFEVTADRTVTIAKMPAASGALTLNPVTVEGQASALSTATASELPAEYAGGQVARGARLGLLGNRDMMDTPFNTSSYTAKTVDDRQAVTVADVVNNDPSVRSSASKGGILDAFFIRGYPIGEGNLGEIAFNGVYGVAPNYRVFTEYAERIEVLKGPTALLYGMAPNSSVGGTINIVPKRAADTDLTRVTADYVQDTQVGSHVDVGRRFGDDKEWGVRLNGSYSTGDTAVDKQSREARVGALALDYRGERLRASIDVIDQVEKLNAPLRPFLIASGVDVPSAPDGSSNVINSWAWSELADRSVQGRVEYDVTDRVTVFADAGAGRTEVDRLSEQVPFITNAQGDTTATPFYYKFEIDRVTYDAGIRASGETGGIDHLVTAQASRYEDTIARGSRSSSTTVTSNIYAPTDTDPVGIAEPTTVPKVSESALTGFALADTLSAFDERVQLTLGTRYQQIEAENFSDTTGALTSSYEDDALTPMVGLVVKPWRNVSLYANYIEGLSKGDVAPSTASNAGEALAPYVATQREVGVKVDFGHFAGVVSLFEIEKPFGQLENNVFTEGGEQRNRGLEVSVFGELTPEIRVFAGATFFDAELTKTNNPATVGNQPIGVPDFQANLSAEWDTPFLAGLTLGGSIIHTGAEYVDTANTQSIPSWTRLDLGARYRTEIAQTPVTFRATVENVFDENYWSGVAGSYGGLGVGAPRTLMLSVSADF